MAIHQYLALKEVRREANYNLVLSTELICNADS